MNEEMKELKERLKVAGVNRVVAGIDAAQDEEEEYYDEEEDEAEAEVVTEKAIERTPEVLHQEDVTARAPIDEVIHVPKIGANTAKEFSRVDRGGIPRPKAMMNDNFLKQGIEVPADVPSMRNSGRDFRIHANSSRTSFGAESNTAKPLNRLPKPRPNLIGANKPHTLKNQNDQIREMLKVGNIGSKPSLEPIDPNKIRSVRQNSVRASQSSLNKGMIGGGQTTQGLTPSLQASEKFDKTVGGTPGKRNPNKGGNM